MLVLSRRVGEEIVIGDNIRIVVAAVQRDRVRLGITAPAAVPVQRRELLDRLGDWTALSVPAGSCQDAR